MTNRLVCAGVVLALLAAGCGDSESEAEKEQSEGARTACTAPAAAGQTGLPAAFPLPGELTITEVRKDGPTIVVDGYWTSGLEEAYHEYKDAVDQAGYTVTDSEKEERDAEVNYAGSKRTGQIALRDNCSESDTTRVHITNRPE
jgi:hypothetical protein